MNQIPFFDYNNLLKSEANSIKLLKETLHTIGFFYLTNLNIAESLFDDVLYQSQLFFMQDSFEKEKISIYRSSHYRGYSKLEDEITNGLPDYKEIVDFGLENTKKKSNVLYYQLLGHNLWPSRQKLPSFKKTLLAYMHCLMEIGAQLMRAIAESLGLSSDFFLKQFKGPSFALMRIIHYPPCLGTEKKIGVGEHTDFGCLTLLHQDQAGGLEVKTRQGTWIQAKPEKNALLINIGDMLEQWTNGFFVATPHRVLNAGQVDRYSVPFFFEPNLDTCIKRASDHVVYGEHIFKAFLRSFPNHPTSKHHASSEVFDE